MIPIFPIQKNLAFEDRSAIEAMTKQFPPYSDYNFISMWSYDTENSIAISQLNNNLVIRFSDYITTEPFYGFIGTEKVEDTITKLLEEARTEGMVPMLKLIPEVSLVNKEHLEKSFIITEDVDNHDYVLSVADIALFSGNKYGSKRNFINRFLKTHAQCVAKIIDAADPTIQQQIIEVFYTWEKNKKSERKDTQIELTAIERLLDKASLLELLSVGIFDNEKMIAFALCEVSHNKYGVIHFEKSDNSFVGIFPFLKQHIAKIMQSNDLEFINYEQDLGIEGLRKAKKSYYPIHYLKKYSISHK